MLFVIQYISAITLTDKTQNRLYPRYLNYIGRSDSALTFLQISRDPTPCMAETALAMVNI